MKVKKAPSEWRGSWQHTAAADMPMQLCVRSAPAGPNSWVEQRIVRPRYSET